MNDKCPKCGASKDVQFESYQRWECGSLTWPDSFTQSGSCRLSVAERERDAWKSAVIEALVVNCIYRNEHDDNPEKALADLVAWECKIALDSLASEEAAKRDALMETNKFLNRRVQQLESEAASTDRQANKTLAIRTRVLEETERERDEAVAARKKAETELQEYKESLSLELRANR